MFSLCSRLFNLIQKKQIIFVSTILIILVSYIAYLTNEAQTCYGVVLDAGSSGTKAQIYQWPCLRSSSVPHFNLNATQSKKFKEPLAHFQGQTHKLKVYFDEIFSFINEKVPSIMRQQTPIILGATAGMRFLSQQNQIEIIDASKTLLSQYGYYFPQSKQNEWCTILSGQQEGAYLWVSVNYLLNMLTFNQNQVTLTVATIELGGASTQIAFLPKAKRVESNQSYDFDMVINGFNDWHIYTYSYLGYGKLKARRNILLSQNPTSSYIIYSPCFFNGYEGIQMINNILYKIKGVGIYSECTQSILNYLDVNKNNCLFQDVKQCAMQNQYQYLIPAHMVIYASSGIQKAAHLLGFNNQFVLRDFSYKTEQLYSIAWKDASILYQEEEDLENSLFLVTYVECLLKFGYNIEVDRQIFVPQKINSVSPGWTLALLMQRVSELSCRELYGQICLELVNDINY
ncbi:hypothetical protein ABPG74_017967 [Tetrahymena malaccensis]